MKTRALIDAILYPLVRESPMNYLWVGVEIIHLILPFLPDGIRIASANTIEMLMEHDFDMIINDNVYNVVTPPQEKPSEVRKKACVIAEHFLKGGINLF
jgi:hypothetical protein